MGTLPHDHRGLAARLWIAVPSLAAFGLGVFLLVSAGSTLIECLLSLGWREAPGKVVDVRIEELDMSAAAKKRWYAVRLSYVFDAAGRATPGHRIGFTVDGRQKREIEKYAATFHPGQDVRVLYSPSNPARSVLERTVGGRSWAMLIGGILLSTFGLGFSVASLRRPGPPERSDPS